MLHDVVIVGAGPVGATLALALAAGEVDVVALDARPARTIARGDRSLALSHGVPADLRAPRHLGRHCGDAGCGDADHGHRYFATRRLRAARLDARGATRARAGICRQLSCAAGRARCRAGARRGACRARICRRSHRRDAGVRLRGRPARRRRFDVDRPTCRSRGRRRRRRRRHQPPPARLRPGRVGRQGLDARTASAASPSSASRRTARWRCCPKTTTMDWCGPQHRNAARALIALPEPEFLAGLRQRFGPRAGDFVRVADRRTFPLSLDFADRVVDRAHGAARQRRAGAASGRRTGFQSRRARRMGVGAGVACDAARSNWRARSHARGMRSGAAPIAGQASRLRTVCSAHSATTRRCCAGREGWHSLCLIRFRR